MIDRENRNKYAEQLRHFAAGVLTVDEYEDRTDDLAFGSKDTALYAVWRNVWGLYDDFRTEHLRGDWALDAETRRWIACSILFLNSDAEYRWPPFRHNAWAQIAGAAVEVMDTLLFPVDVCTFGLFHLRDRWWYRLMKPFRKRQWEERQQFMQMVGEPEYWPFLRRAEYEAALRRPRFLTGRAR